MEQRRKRMMPNNRIQPTWTADVGHLMYHRFPPKSCTWKHPSFRGPHDNRS